MSINDILISIQAQIFESQRTRTDVYYEEGKGALFVPEGYALEPRNVIFAIDEFQLSFMSMKHTL